MSFEQAMKRPSNFYSLSGMEKWAIDRRLGILDWDGRLTEDQTQQYNKRFGTNFSTPDNNKK